MNLLLFVLISTLPFILCSQNMAPSRGERVAYFVDLTRFEAKPAELSPRFMKVSGDGKYLYEWHIVKIDEDLYELSGTVYKDNIAMPTKDAAVFIGNIEIDKTLQLVAKTDDKGQFKIFINNRTFSQIKKAREGTGIISYGSESDKHRTQEEIYLLNKYLYTGDSHIDLFQYEIPYKEAKIKVEDTTSKQTSRTSNNYHIKKVE